MLLFPSCPCFIYCIRCWVELDCTFEFRKIWLFTEFVTSINSKRSSYTNWILTHWNFLHEGLKCIWYPHLSNTYTNSGKSCLVRDYFPSVDQSTCCEYPGWSQLPKHHFQRVQMRFPHVFHNCQEDFVLCNKHILGSLKNKEGKRLNKETKSAQINQSCWTPMALCIITFE